MHVGDHTIMLKVQLFVQPEQLLWIHRHELKLHTSGSLACQFVNHASLKQTSLLHTNEAHSPLNDKMKTVTLHDLVFPLVITAPRTMKLIHRLQPGEVITLNNRRILHGRQSFQLNGGARHLQVS